MSREIKWSASKSHLHCPFMNLAQEENLLRGNFEGDAHFFFYRNTPAIVLGRFQVPWREINFLKLKELTEKFPDKKVEVVRRRSGGGTVYHDLGNWNFCFIRKQRDLLRIENLEIIVNAMREFGIELEISDRFDLTYQNQDIAPGVNTFKVSGCAFKQKKETSLHHGTLLVDANLEFLKGVLGHPKDWQIGGKGIKSCPSPVCNLAPFSNALNFDNFFDTICKHLGCEGSASEISLDDLSEFHELKSWQWLWGETPEFSIQTKLLKLIAKKGLIESAVVQKACGKAIAIDCDNLKLMEANSWKKIKELGPDISDNFTSFY